MGHVFVVQVFGVLPQGGDNSNSAEGSFYEGFMATGASSAATDDAIQANIVAVSYHNPSTGQN